MIWLMGSGIVVLLLALSAWRWRDRHDEALARRRLLARSPNPDSTFDPAQLDGLPEPARRFLTYAIEPGALLHPLVDVEMEGELSLGSKEKPNYRPMRARQLLAAPYGFIWSLSWNGVRGSDGALPDRSWTRFWLFGLIPVARASGPDHLRSSFGRLIADSVFWAPASLLPGEHVRWELLDENSARAIATFGGLEQAVDLYVDELGRLQRLIFQRWSNENPDRVHRLQPFGGEFSDYRSFEGYRLPTTVIAGNHYGTDDYFPFFKARVTDVRFPR